MRDNSRRAHKELKEMRLASRSSSDSSCDLSAEASAKAEATAKQEAQSEGWCAWRACPPFD